MEAIQEATTQLTGSDFAEEYVNEELGDLHEALASLLGLHHPDEYPVVFACDCGAYRLFTNETPTGYVWSARLDRLELTPACACPPLSFDRPTSRLKRRDSRHRRTVSLRRLRRTASRRVASAQEA